MNCSRWSRTVALLAALVIGIPFALQAQDDEPTVTLDFQNVELADVIRSIAKITKRNFLFDDRVRGTVTVISERPGTIDEAYRVFESVLQVKGFSVVEGPGGVLKIVPTRDAAQSPIPIQGEDAPTSERDRFITRLIPLKFIKVDTVRDTFQQLASKDASIIAYAPTNTLIITDSAANIRRVLNIVERIDVSTYEEQIKVLPLQFADATELTNQLKEIFSSGEAATAGGGAATAAARARAAARAAAAAAAAGGAGNALAASSETVGIAGEPRFIPDTRTNSIIVLAPQGTIRQVERLVTLLDYKRPGTGRINIIPLQNADAEETAETLSRLVEGGGSSAPAAIGGTDGAAAGGDGGGSAVVELEGGARITADAPTNSLIIQSTPEAFAALQDVISELDKRRPQVLIEALIMEVQVSDSEQFGSQLIFNTLLGGGDNPINRLGGFGTNPVGGVLPSPPLTGGTPLQSSSTSTMGNMMNNMMSTASNFGSTVGNPFTGTILGNSVSVVDPATGTVTRIPIIQAVITAAATNNDVDIINSPRILTADNEEAQIIVGQEIGFPTTNLQLADPSAQSGFQTSQNVERRDVGVTLRVTPQISEGETIKLEFFQEVSQVATTANISGAIGPTTSNRTVENTVFVKDGEAVLIGGIIQDQLTASETKVPFLGDLPIFGFFFRNTTDMVTKTNLLVILTPHIVRDPLDLERLTIRKREEFRSLAGSSLSFTEEELDARRAAVEAGIDLPLDDNPVRRNLESLTRRYPTETLPSLEEREENAEAERLKRLESSTNISAGRYVVQVALLRNSSEAAELLKQLIASGYDGMVRSRMEGSDTLHVVQLGPYSSEDEAQRVRREVAADSDYDPTVMIAKP